MPLLKAWGMHAEGLALWLLLKNAVQEQRAGEAVFRGMTEYFNRAWFKPLGGWQR